MHGFFYVRPDPLYASGLTKLTHVRGAGLEEPAAQH